MFLSSGFCAKYQLFYKFINGCSFIIVCSAFDSFQIIFYFHNIANGQRLLRHITHPLVIVFCNGIIPYSKAFVKVSSGFL